MFDVHKSGLLRLNSGCLKVKEAIDFLRETVQSLNNGEAADLSGVMERVENTSMLTDNRVTRELLRILLLTTDSSCKQAIIGYLLRHHMHIDLDLPIFVLLPLWRPDHRDTLLTFLSAITGNQQDMTFLAVTNLLLHCAFKCLGHDSTCLLTRALHVLGQNVILVNSIETSLLFQFANIDRRSTSTAATGLSNYKPISSESSAHGKKRTDPLFITMSALFWQVLELIIYRVLELSVPELMGISVSYANSSYMPTYSLTYLTLQPIEQEKNVKVASAGAKESHSPTLHITGTKTVISWADYISFWDHFLSDSKNDPIEIFIDTLSSLVLLAHRLVSHPQLYPDIVSSKQTERSIFFSLELLLIIASVSDRVFSGLSLPNPQLHGHDIQARSLENDYVTMLTGLEKLLNGLVRIAKSFPDNVPEAFVDCYNSVLVTFFRTLATHMNWTKNYTGSRHRGLESVLARCLEKFVALFDAFSQSLHVKAIGEIFECVYALIKPLLNRLLDISELHLAIVNLYLLMFKYNIRTYDFERLEKIIVDLTGLSDSSLIFMTKIELLGEQGSLYNSFNDAVFNCIFPLDHGAFGRLVDLLLHTWKQHVSAPSVAKHNLQYLILSILTYFNYGGVCLQVASFKQALNELLDNVGSVLTDRSLSHLYSMYDTIQAVLHPGVHLASSCLSPYSDEENKKQGDSNTSNASVSPLEAYSCNVIRSLVDTKTFTLSSPTKKEVHQLTKDLMLASYGSENKPDPNSIHILRLYVALQVKSKSNYLFLRTNLSRTSLYLILKASVEFPELILLCYQWNKIHPYAAWYSERAATIVNLGQGVFDGPTSGNELCRLVVASQSEGETVGLSAGDFRMIKTAYALSLENPSVFVYPVDRLFISLLRTAAMSPDVVPLSEILVYRTFNTALEEVGSEILRLFMITGLSLDTLLTYCTSHFKDSPLLIAFCLIAAVYSLQIAPRPIKVKIPRTQGVIFATAFLRRDQLEILRGLVKE
ncbi:Hypothetical protein GLP15_964 [Giardia lamblia P15]|uniref:Uncharacterized protein n=1 Tax=Giardia intestinalis (strain P15) TaxID=658858 RepID=E1EZ42_GIAIA|nr:Hypothetical protein GLP15_964 [Giardia lamblia P15]